MRHGGGFRLLAVLLLVGGVAALTGGAYSAGFVAGAGTNGTTTSPWLYGGAYGASGVIGLVVTVVVLILVLRIVRFAFWRHSFDDWGHGGPGWGSPDGPGTHAWSRHGGRGHGEPWRSARQAAFDEWHRQAHGSTADSGTSGFEAGPQPSGPGTTGPEPR
jgi:hypothetical protein